MTRWDRMMTRCAAADYGENHSSGHHGRRGDQKPGARQQDIDAQADTMRARARRGAGAGEEPAHAGWSGPGPLGWPAASDHHQKTEEANATWPTGGKSVGQLGMGPAAAEGGYQIENNEQRSREKARAGEKSVLCLLAWHPPREARSGEGRSGASGRTSRDLLGAQSGRFDDLALLS